VPQGSLRRVVRRLDPLDPGKAPLAVAYDTSPRPSCFKLFEQ
jgi:hypothetical protein